MNLSRHALRWGVVSATSLALVGGGVAVAAWTSSGDGTTTAKAGTASAPTTSTVEGSAITTGLLYPGGAAGDAKITVNNPNPYPVKVSSVTQHGTVTADGGTGTCTATGVSLGDQTPNTSIGANDSATFTLSNAATMSTESQDGCQGAVFTIPVTVTVVSG